MTGCSFYAPSFYIKKRPQKWGRDVSECFGKNKEQSDRDADTCGQIVANAVAFIVVCSASGADVPTTLGASDLCVRVDGASTMTANVLITID